MIGVFSLLCHSALATTSTQVTPAETARCSWLPDLIKHTNDPAVVEAGRKVCKEASRFTQYQFAPMHQAALIKNDELLTALHDIGHDIDQPDVVGFTPLHILAMNGHTIGVSLLLGWGANPEHRNTMGGTYADLLRMNEPFRDAAAFPLNRTLFSAHTSGNVVIDPRCQPKGVTYVDENVATPRDLRMMWQKVATKKYEQRTSTLDERVKYTAFKAAPPKLSIKPVTVDDAGKPVDFGPSFCGVFAEEPIKKGYPIAEYVGQMFSADSLRGPGVDMTYVWDEDLPPIDSKQFRSAGAMINDAFPNAVNNNLYAHEQNGLDGIPNRRIITAINDIAAGEQITQSYGDYTWHVPRRELRPNALRKFIEQNTWAGLYQAVVDYSKQRPNADMGKVTQFLTIIQSTDNLVDLAKGGLLTKEDMVWVTTPVNAMELSTDLKPVEKAIAARGKSRAAKASKTPKAPKVKTDL